MHIKKLEICGFKSFVDKTVIPFDHDVLGIVGPNGCGKSNIVDAIRWCLGEQNARHLRGKAMEDVIFSGSESRGPHGFAEVTLTFDNTDAEQAASLPVEYRDYAELAVTRRLFRDGTSEYLINKTPVRLKDVVDVFLGTGVGSKAYSIVEQGKIGLIVSARPEDRRILIEEAAGITKYKARKKAAERKMEQTEQNLLRVGDRVAELERSVASLQRQAQKAQRYVAYRGELEDLQLHAASHRLLELAAIRTYETAERETAETEAARARAELDTKELELETLRTEALGHETVADAAQNAAFVADNEVRTLEAEIARATDRLAHLAARETAAGSEQTELAKKADELDVERAEVELALETLEAEESGHASTTLGEHERLEALRGEERAADAALSALRNRVSQASSRVAGAEAKLAGFARRVGEMQQRREKLERDAATIEAERAHVGERHAEVVGTLEATLEAHAAATDERSRLDAELRAVREEVLAAEKALEHARTDLSRQRGRLHALEDLHARLEGFGVGVKKLVGTKDPAILGLVVDRIEAPSHLTAAVAGLLGDALQLVVVDDTERGVALLAELSRTKAGRATIVPRSPRRVVGAARAPLAAEGVLGALVEHLSYAPEDESLVRALVGDAIVVETAALAIELAPSASGRVLVALDGTVVHPDGRVSGGSPDAVAAGHVDQKREIHELRDACSAAEAALSTMVEAHAALRSRLGSLGAALDHARQMAHEAELAKLTAEKDQRRLDEQIAATDRRAAAAARELDELGRALAEASHEHDSAASALEEGRAILAEAEGQVEGAVETASRWRDEVSAQLAIVTERKVLLARVREQVSAARGTVERLSRSVGELRARIARLEDERATIAREEGETAATVVVGRDKLGDAVDVARAAQDALAEARRVLDEARQALAEREIDLKALRSHATAAAEKLSSHELSLERARMAEGHLLDDVRDRFRGLDLRRVVGDYHLRPAPDAEHEARTSDLVRLIDRMGPVNLDAMKEHEEEEKRLEFYVTNKADIEKALEDLRRVIHQMNRESKRLFAETFTSINERFQRIFPKMFRGGRAELRLTNPDDLLETGVEIVAQPPGKKLGNIELMSGGEKALTAVSLIFAIFQHKPSPFCILDEVDAPLDEANVTRYNEFVREMTDRSQFILITHIKKTMQSVDALFGVTMQEPGISRLVSVKINETAQQRSGKPTTSEQVAVA